MRRRAFFWNPDFFCNRGFFRSHPERAVEITKGTGLVSRIQRTQV
jgi:hypothetical protein